MLGECGKVGPENGKKGMNKLECSTALAGGGVGGQQRVPDECWSFRFHQPPLLPLLHLPTVSQMSGLSGKQADSKALSLFPCYLPPPFTLPSPLCLLAVSPLLWLPAGFHFFSTSFRAPAASEMSYFSRRGPGSGRPEAGSSSPSSHHSFPL